MLGIYADVIRTATRTEGLELRELPPAKTRKWRWFSPQRKVFIDLEKL